MRLLTRFRASTRGTARRHDSLGASPNALVALSENMPNSYRQIDCSSLGGELDLGFVRRTDDPAFDHVEVLSDPYVLLAPSDAEIAKDGRPLRPREIARLPLVAYRRAGEGGEALLRARGADLDGVFRSVDSAVLAWHVGGAAADGGLGFRQDRARRRRRGRRGRGGSCVAAGSTGQSSITVLKPPKIIRLASNGALLMSISSRGSDMTFFRTASRARLFS